MALIEYLTRIKSMWRYKLLNACLRDKEFELLISLLIVICPGGSQPILLGTDIWLRFSKHPHSYIQYF
jgi:hypothetical protein